MANEQPPDTRTDIPWPGWTGVRRGPDHTAHAGHPTRDREEQQS